MMTFLTCNMIKKTRGVKNIKIMRVLGTFESLVHALDHANILLETGCLHVSNGMLREGGFRIWDCVISVRLA